MSRQYVLLKDRKINDQFSRWLYRSIINNYGSIEFFSQESGICKANIYRWIDGSYKPDRKNLIIISKMFHVSVDYLLLIM